MPSVLQWGGRLRYLAGNSWRRLSSPWLEHEVPVSECRSLFGASFGDDGWHHIRETLKEFDVNPRIDYRQTSLYVFLTRFCPSSISEVAGVTDGAPLPLFVYPWGTFRKGETASSKDPWTSRFCGPSTDQFVADEFDRIINLYRQIRVIGYRPYQYPHSFIAGTQLEALDGSRRFVVLQGNHRTAILAHLGVRRIAVRPLRGRLAVVREADVDKWMLVRSGDCTVAHARAVFRWFFHPNGAVLRRSIVV